MRDLKMSRFALANRAGHPVRQLTHLYFFLHTVETYLANHQDATVGRTRGTQRNAQLRPWYHKASVKKPVDLIFEPIRILPDEAMLRSAMNDHLLVRDIFRRLLVTTSRDHRLVVVVDESTGILSSPIRPKESRRIGC